MSATTSPSSSPHLSPRIPLPFTYNSSYPPVLLTQGAEAHVFKTHFVTPAHPAVLKVRPSKPYRHPILDRRLTRQRILQEARCLVKLVREGVPVPGVLALDWEGESKNPSGSGPWLLMEWIDGFVVRQVVERWEDWVKSSGVLERHWDDANAATRETEEICTLMRKIGHVVGAMHKAGVIHGDLTTSNLILRPIWKGNGLDEDGIVGSVTPTIAATDMPGRPSLDGEVVLIDFGLASQGVQDEDRAVDLYVLERAFGSTHPRTEAYFKEVLKAYGESFTAARTVLKKLEEVRMRGRKRSMVG